MDKPDTYVSSQRNDEAATAVLIITDSKCNDQEFFYPYYRFCEAGLRVDVASPEGGDIKTADGHEFKDTYKLMDVANNEYALLYLPGGKAPASLRKDERVLQYVQSYAASGRPIAAICHGAQILAAADVIKGKRISAWPEVESEVEKAGATYVNAALVEDGQFITGRWPGDLPLHTASALRHISKGSAGWTRSSAA